MVTPIARPDNVVLRDARILPGSYRNFSGRGDQYNREGDRNFTVELPEDVARAMIDAGWNIRVRDPREEGDAPQFLFKVAVSYKFKTPQINLISGNTRNLLPEDLVAIIDDAEILKADLIVEPSVWEVNGNTGIKAYLKTAFITVFQDELSAEYDHIPLSSN